MAALLAVASAVTVTVKKSSAVFKKAYNIKNLEQWKALPNSNQSKDCRLISLSLEFYPVCYYRNLILSLIVNLKFIYGKRTVISFKRFISSCYNNDQTDFLVKNTNLLSFLYGTLNLFTIPHSKFDVDRTILKFNQSDLTNTDEPTLIEGKVFLKNEVHKDHRSSASSL